MIAAEIAIRAWVTGKLNLVGPGNPLANGAFTRTQRSPASGCYAVLARTTGTNRDVVAEPAPGLTSAMIAFTVYGGTAETAEIAASALATEIEKLAGCPEPAGPGVNVLVASGLTGPTSVPWAPDAGEQFAFNLSAEFLLAAA